MVAQYFQNLAFCHAVAATIDDHSLQFLVQSLQTFQPLLDLAQLASRDGMRLVTGLSPVV